MHEKSSFDLLSSEFLASVHSDDRTIQMATGVLCLH